MIDEQELDRQRALEGWDEESCREFEEFLDEMYWESQQDHLEDEYREEMERRAYNEGHVAGQDPF